jgi:uncharacterized protein YbjT (DUF2867 family)
MDSDAAPVAPGGSSYGAVVIGATGAVGSALVRELIASPRCERVVALSRRQTDALGISTKLTVHVIDLAQVETATRGLAAGCKAAFCTLGLGQPSRASFQEFWRVDVEYAGAFARGAAQAGAEHISLLSSVGANAASRTRYLRVKGSAEQMMERSGIPRVSCFRPSLLVTREIRYGVQDRLTQALFPLIAPLLPARYHQIRVEDLARAMRVNAERPAGAGVEVLEYPDFVRL